MKILVIEDSRILQAGIKRALTKAGHEVIIAGDGREGLALASTFHPDLILLDMMLPTMMGTDVLRVLKSQPATKDIAVFVLTGLSQKNAIKVLHAGATKYFEKSDLLLGENFASLVQAINDMTIAAAAAV
jgi:DNA-binding response OmpR family regulator